MPRWTWEVLARVRRLVGAGLIRFTYKARTELMELALDEEDATEVVAGLSAREVAGRLWAEPPGEWLYVFRSNLEGTSLYIKLALRGHCVVLSFHEEDEECDDQGPTAA